MINVRLAQCFSSYLWIDILQKITRVMATANVSEDTKQLTYEELMCWEGLTAAPGIHDQLIFLSVLNIFFSIIAFLGNSLILVALRKESSLHPPSKLLLRSLAATDFCVGLIAEPLAIAYWMSVVNEDWIICCSVSAAFRITSVTLGGVSLVTMTLISVDRLLALLLGLRYRQVVTLKRTYMIVVSSWVGSAAITTMYFWNSLITWWSIMIVEPLCLLTSIFSYTKIFVSLRHHQARLQDQAQRPNKTFPLNIAMYKEAVLSVIWLQVTLVACYLPQGIVSAFSINSVVSVSVFLASHYTATLVFINSSLNPILYCWKIKEVRQAVKETIRQVLCGSSCQLMSSYIIP